MLLIDFSTVWTFSPFLSVTYKGLSFLVNGYFALDKQVMTRGIMQKQ
jgi:hypothetical protein